MITKDGFAPLLSDEVPEFSETLDSLQARLGFDPLGPYLYQISGSLYSFALQHARNIADDAARDLVGRILRFVERCLTDGEESVEKAVCLNFVQAIDPREPGADLLTSMMGPASRACWNALVEWNEELLRNARKKRPQTPTR